MAKKKTMKVDVDANGLDITLGSKGVVLSIWEGTDYLGKLRIGKSTLEWCKGKTHIGNGQKINLRRFVADHLEKL